MIHSWFLLNFSSLTSLKLSFFCFDSFPPVFHSSTVQCTEPAQRIVKAELVDYPQDEGPIRQENGQKSKICLVQ